MKKRICVFSLAYEPYMGGAEIAVREITGRLEAGYSFDVITVRFDRSLPKHEVVGAVTVHRVGIGGKNPSPHDLLTWPLYLNKVFFTPLAFFKAMRLHLRHRFDLVWSVMSYMGFPALFFKLFFDVPLVLTLQEGDTSEHITRRFRIRVVGFLYRAIFKHAKVVQAISTYLADFARTEGYQGTPIVIPNGVNTEQFSRNVSDENIHTIRTRHNISHDAYILITTSRLVPKNGIDTVISALTHLAPDAHFLILGEGPDKKKLTAHAEAEGVAGRVIFAGEVSHDILPDYLQASDVFVRMSRSEGMGNSFIEAMAAGIPVVATPVGGIVDFLFDPRTPMGQVLPTGIFAEVDNPESVADAVARIRAKDVLRARMVEGARKLVREKYDWSRIAHDMDTKVFARALS